MVVLKVYKKAVLKGFSMEILTVAAMDISMVV
jgi:hypothetical protein